MESTLRTGKTLHQYLGILIDKYAHEVFLKVLKDGKSNAFYDAIIVTMNQQEVSKRMLDAGYWLLDWMLVAGRQMLD
jgi:hypothetical protein